MGWFLISTVVPVALLNDPISNVTTESEFKFFLYSPFIFAVLKKWGVTRFS